MSELANLVLHDRHLAAGARFAGFAGYEMPMRYSTIKEEHRLVRTYAGIFDVSHMGEVFVRGPEAMEAVNRLVTNDLARLKLGQAMYTVMCHPDGGIVDDLIIYRLGEEEILIVVNAANRQKDFAWITKHLEGDAEATDESDAWVQLALQGPEALDIAARASTAFAEPPAPFHTKWVEFDGHRVLLARTGYTGEDGFEFYVPNDGAHVLNDALFAAGGERLGFIGLGARDSLRLEARLPLYGNDIDDTTNPYEAGLGWVVKLDKESFIGKDALAKVKAEGVTRRLRGLVLEGKGMLRAGYGVYAGEEMIGTTTSGSLGISVGEVAIGLAYLAVEHANDERVEVEIRNRRVPARVTKKPFYKRS